MSKALNLKPWDMDLRTRQSHCWHGFTRSWLDGRTSMNGQRMRVCAISALRTICLLTFVPNSNALCAVFTWISIYYFSRSGPAASVRIYRENHKSGNSILRVVNPISVPIGFSYFPKEILRFPKAWVIVDCGSPSYFYLLPWMGAQPHEYFFLASSQLDSEGRKCRVWKGACVWRTFCRVREAERAGRGFESYVWDWWAVLRGCRREDWICVRKTRTRNRFSMRVIGKSESLRSIAR